MTRLIASELLKLRSTRAPIILAAVWFALAVGLVVLNFRLTSDLELELADEQEILIRSLVTFIGLLIAPIIGIGIAATDIRHRVIAATLLNEPRRERVITGKFIVAAIVGAAVGAVVSAAAIGSAALIILAEDFRFGMSATDIVAAIGAGAVFGALMCLLGFGVGSVVMNQTAAIVLTLAFLIIVQSILIFVIPESLIKWIPGLLAVSVSELWGPIDVDRGDEIFSAGVSALVLLGYGVALSALGALRLKNTDIT